MIIVTLLTVKVTVENFTAKFYDLQVVIFALLVALMICDWLRSQRKSAALEERRRLEFAELEQRKIEAQKRLESLQRETELARAELLSQIGELPLRDEQRD